MTMTRMGLRLGPILVIAGAVLAAPGLVLMGLLALFVAGITGLWTRFGLRRLDYERKVARDRTVFGDDIPMEIAVHNRKLLPLWWVSVEDFVTPKAEVREQAIVPDKQPKRSVLRTRWSVGWYERVVRHFTIASDRRGVYSFGPVRVSVPDLIGYGVATEDREIHDTYIVRPRTLVVRRAGNDRSPAGDIRTRQSLFEDPALFSGVRPYRPGDPLRRIHWRATARTGAIVSKRFDPSRAHTIMIAIDIQTASGRIWTNDEEMVESLIVAASSLARQALLEGASCGLATLALSRSIDAFAFAPPRTGRGQLSTIADVLGRLDAIPSAPFEHLLVRLPQRVQLGTTIMVVTARDPEPYAEALVRLHRLGYPIQVIGLGDNGPAAAARARSLGFSAMTGSLNPDWRTSDALVLAS